MTSHKYREERWVNCMTCVFNSKEISVNQGLKFFQQGQTDFQKLKNKMKKNLFGPLQINVIFHFTDNLTFFPRDGPPTSQDGI